MRPFTPEELAIAKRMSDAGHTRRETLALIRIAPATFDHHCKAAGITFTAKPHAKRVPERLFTPEELDLVRTEAAAGTSKRNTQKLIRIGWDQFARLCRDHGILFKSEQPKPKVEKPSRKHLRGAASNPKAKRNPMNILQAWKPPVATSDIDLAVQKLRRKYPVFAEDTLRRQDGIPRPYGPETRFRVGHMRDVPVERVLEMARAA